MKTFNEKVEILKEIQSDCMTGSIERDSFTIGNGLIRYKGLYVAHDHNQGILDSIGNIRGYLLGMVNVQTKAAMLRVRDYKEVARVDIE